MAVADASRSGMPYALEAHPGRWARSPGKRAMDVVLSAGGLIALSGPLLALAALVRLTSPGPAIYGALRVGIHGRLFRMYKFRSMVDGADAAGPLITAAGDPRITPLGHWLRRTKLDELPALWNVLIGDMSLVGPRPENPRSASLYTAQQRRVLAIRPGLSSRASIKYRDEEALLGGGADLEESYFRVMQDKLRLDLEYVDHASVGADLRIIGTTLATLLHLRSPGA
jgi:lipopolysaccharide/colanic/teichoic acid biosynthesis glycosyltransferase